MNDINKPHLSRRWDDELYHFQIKGAKWGVRRFQNLDRTWTEAGKIRYGRKGNGRSNANESIIGVNPKKLEKEYVEYANAGAKRILNGRENDNDREMDRISSDFVDELFSQKQSINDSDSESAVRRVEDIFNKFANKTSKVELRGMGYSDDDDSVAWLQKQPWYTEITSKYDVAYDIIDNHRNEIIKARDDYSKRMKNASDNRNDINVKDTKKVEKQFEKNVRFSGTKSLIGGDHSKDETNRVRNEYLNAVVKNRKQLRRGGMAEFSKPYYRRYAIASLKEMGYEPNDHNVEWLMNQYWFRIPGGSDMLYD